MIVAFCCVEFRGAAINAGVRLAQVDFRRADSD